MEGAGIKSYNIDNKKGGPISATELQGATKMGQPANDGAAQREEEEEEEEEKR